MNGNEFDEPADLKEVHADDELIDALANGDASTTDPAAAHLSRIVAALAEIPLPAAQSVRPTGGLARRRLLALPAAAVVLLGATGAAAVIGTSQSSPLHGVHTLIFGSDRPGPAQVVRMHLASAATELQAAAAGEPSARAGQLLTARADLHAACRQLRTITDQSIAQQLRSQLKTLERWADQLEGAATRQPPARTVHVPPPGGSGTAVTSGASPHETEPTGSATPGPSSTEPDGGAPGGEPDGGASGGLARTGTATSTSARSTPDPATSSPTPDQPSTERPVTDPSDTIDPRESPTS